MKVPISWIKDFVDIDLPLPELARLLTMAGLEVEEILLCGDGAAAGEGGNAASSGHLKERHRAGVGAG